MRIKIASDIHGAYDVLADAVTPADTLFLLGDYINVIDYKDMSGLMAEFVDEATIRTVARRLAMSVATPRRRLGDESTSHSEILDDVRRELAEKYLADMSLAISEVAFLLGFSHVTAFYKAFRRWSQGVTPAEFRAQSQRR